MSKLIKYIFIVAVCVCIPAAVVWDVLPVEIHDHPNLLEFIRRGTAIYLTIAVTWIIISIANTLVRMGADKRSSHHQQYLNSFVSVLKIILIFIALVTIIAIILDKDPSTLLAGLGAASAILMLAFQDTIKGLVAGIRLASNDMLAIGDRITMPAAGVDGKVEEIRLTTVKIRNFDNTISTISPQALVDGSFQNWKGMVEREGRKVMRRIYFDFRSIVVKDDQSTQDTHNNPNTSITTNMSLYRQHMEQYLAKHPMVVKDQMILVHQQDATPTGLPIEFVFWLKDQDYIPYEHTIADIMEYAYAQANAYGLTIYQQFPNQDKA